MHENLELLELIIKKNAINLRRRRFLILGYKAIDTAPLDFVEIRRCAAYRRKARDEMKHLTPRIKELCHIVNARLIWNTNWSIVGICFKNDNRIIHIEDFNKLHLDLMAEKHLLGV